MLSLKGMGDLMEMKRNIKLSPGDVKEFVRVASKCDFDIDIFYNSFIVDAKSILGVFGLDLTKVLTVRYNGYDDRFEQMLNGLAVAC